MSKDKDYEIRVNGTLFTVQDEVVTFDQLIKLAFPTQPTDPNIVFSVTYEDALKPKHQGTLQSGGEVTVKKKGTTFDVTQTNRS